MGNTVLHILCSYGHDVLASKVYKKDGSLLRARNKMLEMPLHCSAKAGEGETIIKLIEFARSDGEPELKEMLRNKNKHGETALYEAARHNHKGIIDELMMIDPELAYEVDYDGICALDVAIDRGERGVVASMIGKWPNQKIDSRIYCSRPKRTTSHSTHKREREGTSERPIEMPNSVDIFTSSPIHRAVLVGNTDVAELLLENDDSLAYLQYDGVFPIHIAAHKGHLKMVLLFLERYLDSAELLDHHGRNFLHIAAEENNSSVFVRLLGETKCNKLTYNKLLSFWRKMSARMSGKTDNFELFKKLNNNPFLPIWKKIMARMINETDNEGNTPLHLAVEKRCKSTMFTLLANKKVDINLRNRKGLTPFDISVIQVKGSTKNSMMMQGWIEKYLENRGPKFTPVWVRAFIPIIDGEGSMTDQIQIIGLGAVLITTVTFAAAFTLPGGNDSNGLPVMGGKYIFKAFMVANSLAFVYSFLCIITLISGGLTPMEPEAKHLYLSTILTLFSSAARYMVLAFGLGV
ncbi:hypothetical protein LUZ60_010578 [Juncus effusus]|nr:hypothetical protein LUZ60_010578 [Juncus effusus]